NGVMAGFGYFSGKVYGKDKPIYLSSRSKINVTSYCCTNLVYFDEKLYISKLGYDKNNYELITLGYHNNFSGKNLSQSNIYFPPIPEDRKNKMVDIKRILVNDK